MEPPLRGASFLPTVKCSSCAVDIDLSKVADHVCSDITTASLPQAQAGESLSTQSVTITPTPLMEEPASMPQAQQQDGSRPRGPSIFKPNRPVLPRLDSSVHGRSGLHPSEAASIAHELGLPSPVSAGGSGRRSPGRNRSRSRSRKASAPRHTSNELPLSQDCAFPPFPMKPKRSQTDKDVSSYKSRSSSRTATSSRPTETSSLHSASSSVYSAGSGYVKRRTSNTSSNQRSRKGTIDESMSMPSTASSSPRQSVSVASLSREQSFDHVSSMPPLVPSQTNTLSEPTSTISSGMPSTPSWPLEQSEAVPGGMTSLVPTTSNIGIEDSEGQYDPTEVKKAVHFDSGVDKSETFDKMLSQQPRRTSIDMFDNPPKEPLYKAKRPPPLPQLQRRATEDPKSAAAAHTNNGPLTGGLTRTFTRVFGRKRSQSTNSKKQPMPATEGPRIDALGLDDPEEASRDDLVSISTVSEGQEDRAPSSLVQQENHIERPISPMSGSLVNEDTTHLTHAYDQDDTGNQGVNNLAADFNFSFQNNSNHDSPDNSRFEDDRGPSPHDSGLAPNSGHDSDEHDLRRASIDSASSYGSIGFSNRTVSSRSSLPPFEESRKKLSTVFEPEQSPESNDEGGDDASPTQEKTFVPESPTDPFYRQGTLAPVSEAQPPPPSWPLAMESPASPEKSLLSPQSEANAQELSRTARSPTPAGVKGVCRGCSQLIVSGQKSVASADGRLTGRYHKECFVCQTCKEAFSTADFYVHDDHPYCAHHYHVLNNTLCTGCGKGIEGQYQETFDVSGTGSKKFHSHCLQCSTCRVQLNDDYFEYHGRVYCERDAFRAAGGPRSPYDTVPSRPSPLVREYINSGEPGLKGRFPERRITRLIAT